MLSLRPLLFWSALACFCKMAISKELKNEGNVLPLGVTRAFLALFA